jgi:hypothetical protein
VEFEVEKKEDMSGVERKAKRVVLGNRIHLFVPSCVAAAGLGIHNSLCRLRKKGGGEISLLPCPWGVCTTVDYAPQIYFQHQMNISASKDDAKIASMDLSFS